MILEKKHERRTEGCDILGGFKKKLASLADGGDAKGCDASPTSSHCAHHDIDDVDRWNPHSAARSHTLSQGSKTAT